MRKIDKQALRERYSEKPAPKCHICGSVMTIQRAGAGGVVYGCTGRIDKDGEGYKFAEGRDFADDHYARSRVTVADESDPDVLSLLDELKAKDQRIAELSASHGKLREAMAGIHNTISGGGAYKPLAAILNASKRAYEESAAAAGKGEAS
ncbi:ead/Ea22-like family protein [Enterobacter cloacae]|uniref:ead/Ea22-like family protein n=1 Tax=Enterobacter cloacae TaxID=550 RepID=UPI00188D5941|nr:ead/Ea22-like family protein [Enterobacter cloacae]MBF4156774.1 ead/Ea22-like family protein [Enterobacter cloacae]HAS0921051.1 ead/Ea22-like family protein [Enterobacter cloacae]